MIPVQSVCKLKVAASVLNFSTLLSTWVVLKREYSYLPNVMNYHHNQNIIYVYKVHFRLILYFYSTNTAIHIYVSIWNYFFFFLYFFCFYLFYSLALNYFVLSKKTGIKRFFVLLMRELLKRTRDHNTDIIAGLKWRSL